MKKIKALHWEKQLPRKLSKFKTETTVQLISEHIMFETLPIYFFFFKNHTAVVMCANPSFPNFYTRVAT